jgi:hypothetical protein
MTGHDPEFEEFLKRRRPLFRREVDEGLEPPAEVDRLVLDRARDAIREPEPMRFYRGPRWAAPMAIAATLVLGLAFVFHSGTPETRQVVPEVRVENVSARYVEPAAPAPTPAPPPPSVQQSASAGTADTMVVDLVPPSAATPVAGETPAWRRDPGTWLAEIERLRAAGETARADAEMAEFNRLHRAQAGSPDR